MSAPDPFAGHDLPTEIDTRARALGLELDAAILGALATHARLLLDANRTTNLTGIVDAAGVLDRHVGESLAGAALLGAPPDGADRLVDLGSGNGYPGLPVALARGLRPVLVESSARKVAFLRVALERCAPGGAVVASHVDRPTDLDGLERTAVVVTRAMGGWERIVPRLARALPDGATVLLWAGEQAADVVARAAWRRDLEPVERRPLPGRDRSWVWRLDVVRGAART